jgi:hypothetical protein
MDRARRLRGLALSLLAIVVLVGCDMSSSPGDPPTVAAPADSPASSLRATQSPPPTQAPSTQTPSSPSPSADLADVLPPELSGQWRTTLGDEVATLTLLGGSYRVSIGPVTGGGKIAVTDDVIEFFGSPFCEGSGLYTWAIEGSDLTFTPVEPDGCPSRTKELVGVTYTLFLDMP